MTGDLDGHTYPRIDITVPQERYDFHPPGPSCAKCGAPVNCLDVIFWPGWRELSCCICGWSVGQKRREKPPKDFRIDRYDMPRKERNEPSPVRMCEQCQDRPAQKHGKFCLHCAEDRKKLSSQHYYQKRDLLEQSLVDTIVEFVELTAEA